jgi:transposase
MQVKGTTIDFKGQNVYAGIDIHLKSWKVTIMLGEREHKTFSQDPNAETLWNYLRKNFPGANYYSAYEAGFCGFNAHRELVNFGVSNLVVNPSDIPTTDKEKKQKEDKRDSRKIARSLKNGELESIYIPSKAIEELRGLVRYRKTLVKEISRTKNRIKSLLYFSGITIPVALDSASKHWSGRFTQWLKSVEMATSYGNLVLAGTLDTSEYLRKQLLLINKELRKISCDSQYAPKLKLLQSIPGIALITSITLLSEMEDIMRFKNLDQLCSFVGLVPTTKSSGEKEKTGKITPRSNLFLRSSIIESAWIASSKDPSLAYSFNQLCKRMQPHDAIIRIAKKLLNRIRYVIKNETEYVHSVL